MRTRTPLVSAVLAAIVATGCGAGPGAQIVQYSTDPSRRALMLTVEVGPSDVVGPAAVTEQTDSDVTVRVSVSRSDNQPGVAVRKQVELDLDRPLGDRRVLDEAGSPVPSRPAAP